MQTARLFQPLYLSEINTAYKSRTRIIRRFYIQRLNIHPNLLQYNALATYNYRGVKNMHSSTSHLPS